MYLLSFPIAPLQVFRKVDAFEKNIFPKRDINGVVKFTNLFKQDSTLFQESANDVNTALPQGLGSSAPVIPYPTRNLCFYDGTLEVWDRR